MTQQFTKEKHLLKKAYKSIPAKPYSKGDLIHRGGVKQFIKKVDSKTFISVAIAVISSPAYAGINDASDPVLNIDTQIESITTEVENKINEIVEHTAANKPAYDDVTPSEAPSSKSIPQINDQALQADIPDWNFDGLPYTRTYQEADEQPTESNNPDSQRYTIDNDKAAAISGDY